MMNALSFVTLMVQVAMMVCNAMCADGRQVLYVVSGDASVDGCRGLSGGRSDDEGTRQPED